MSEDLGREPVAHRNLVVLESAEDGLLDTLFSEPRVRSALWYRLDKRRVVVDPAAVDDLLRVMKEIDLTPRFRVGFSGTG